MRTTKHLYPPGQLFVLGFVFTILIGTVLLLMPFAHRGTLSTVDAVFMATSATCVTGLSSIPITTELTFIGQLIILGLIQIGGIGIMTYAAFFSIMLAGRFLGKSGYHLQDIMDIYDIEKLRSLIIGIFKYTFLLELIGGILLFYSRPLMQFEFTKRIYYAIFHAVSAFCNAGFTLYQDSFMGINSLYFLSVIAVLIILGGLGFWVFLDIQKFNIREPLKSYNKFLLHTKITINVTIFLLILGTVLFFISEFNNTLSGLTPLRKVFHSFFLSVTSRTAGFNTLPTGGLSFSALFLLLIFMFIGASSGSTGGGIKTTTFGILILKLWQIITGKKDVEAFKRRVPNDNVIKALAILFISFIILSVFIYLLFLTGSYDFLPVLFESMSAFGTVGLSTGLTSQLDSEAKIIISLLMLVGRVGPLTLALSLTKKKVPLKYTLPEEKILVG